MQYSRLIFPCPLLVTKARKQRTPLSEASTAKKAKANDDVRLPDDDAMLKILKLHAE